MKNSDKGSFSVDRELTLLHKKIRLSYIQPTNYVAEKKKIFKDKTYNPILKYAKYPYNLQVINQRLLKLRTNQSVLGKLLDEKRKEYLKQVELITNIGKPGFPQLSKQIYGVPSKEVIQKAKKFLDLPQEENNRTYNTISTMKKFVDTLLSNDLKWKVEEKDMVVGAAFSIPKKTVYINKQRKFSHADIQRLLVHELGTHVRRAENGKKQKLNMFVFGFPNYLKTEEGLAVFNEERSGLLSNEVLRTYAGRAVAVDLALKNSFSTVYTTLLEFFPKEEAYTIALRVKRGMTNTVKPGAHTKDHIYLSGWYSVKNFIAQGGRLSQLYIGKIGVQHVHLINKL